MSIPSNIAEGQGRAQPGEFLNSLSVARGSLQELETQLMIAQRRRYLTAARLESLLEMSAAFQSVAHKTAHHIEVVNAFVEKRKPDFSAD